MPHYPINHRPLSVQKKIKIIKFVLVLIVSASVLLFLLVVRKNGKKAYVESDAVLTDSILCDFEFTTETDGGIAVDGANYRIFKPGLVGLSMKCSNSGYIHIALSSDSHERLFLNGQSNQGIVKFNSKPWAVSVKKEVEVSIFESEKRIKDSLFSKNPNDFQVNNFLASKSFRWRNTARILVGDSQH